MNQSIHFPDRETYDENKLCITFPALVNGMLVECSISFDKLRGMFGQELSVERLKAVFIKNRLDIEELVEKLINNRCFNESGAVVLD